MATLLEIRAQVPKLAYERLHLGFVLHATEMILAALLGMGIGSLVGLQDVADPVVRAVLWLVAMSLPMVAWMRIRGHSWRCAAEMTAAMAAPTVALFPLFWVGTISDATWNGIQHGWMTPAMLALMAYRRRQYRW